MSGKASVREPDGSPESTAHSHDGPPEVECNICLDIMRNDDTIGIVPCCGRRFYHSRCILTWSKSSNGCPQCRKRYHKVHIAKFATPSDIVECVDVSDKLPENPAINDIPTEYIVPASLAHELSSANPETHPGTITSAGVCSICSSSDYRSSIRNMVACAYCGANFHLNCLGITNSTSLANWNCPICDCFQQLLLPELAPLLSHRRVPRSTRPAPRIVHSTPRTTGSSPLRRPGLVIHNNNDELDVDFLYDNDTVEEPVQTVINGGVLLRKELRIQQNLSEEERKSWAGFESLRNGTESTMADSTINPTGTTTKRRRRRKKLTPTEPNSTANTPTNGTTGRISTLLSQLRTSTSRTHVPQYPPPQPLSNVSESPSSLSPSSNSLNEYSGESDTQYDSDSKIVKKSRPELSLDHKIEIQKHIRNNLRPLYKGNQSSAPLIHSEDQYIKINKMASRKIYQHILNGSIENGSVNSLFIDGIFNEDNQTRLRQIVNEYVEEELGSIRH